MELTTAYIKAIMPNVSLQNATKFCTTFNNLKWLHKMTTLEEVSAYVANVAHETMELQFWEEIASGEEYEGREDLGNTWIGDGKRFKGRAWLMCTGRYNYGRFTKWYNKMFKESADFITNPEQLSKDAAICQIASLWFWQYRKIKSYAVKGDFEKVCNLINGGLNGYQKRFNYYQIALQTLKQ